MILNQKRNIGIYSKNLYVLSAVALMALYVGGGEDASATLKSGSSSSSLATTASKTVSNASKSSLTSTGSLGSSIKSSKIGGTSNTSKLANPSLGSSSKLGSSTLAGSGIQSQDLGEGSSQQLPKHKIQHKFGNDAANFKVIEGTDIDPNKKYVQFTNTDGKLKTYVEGPSTKAKLLWNDEETGVDSYIGNDGRVRKYLYRSKPNWVDGKDILEQQKIKNEETSSTISSGSRASSIGSIPGAGSSVSEVGSSSTSSSRGSVNSNQDLDSSSSVADSVEIPIYTGSNASSGSSRSGKSSKTSSSIGIKVSDSSLRGNPSEGSTKSDLSSTSNKSKSSSKSTKEPSILEERYRTNLNLRVERSQSGNNINFTEEGKEVTKTLTSIGPSGRRVTKISIADKSIQSKPEVDSKGTQTSKTDLASDKGSTASKVSKSSKSDKAPKSPVKDSSKSDKGLGSVASKSTGVGGTSKASDKSSSKKGDGSIAGIGSSAQTSKSKGDITQGSTSGDSKRQVHKILIADKGVSTPIKANVKKVELPGTISQVSKSENVKLDSNVASVKQGSKTPTSGKGTPVVGETSKSDTGSKTSTKETSTSKGEGSVTQVSTASGKRKVNKISIADKSGQTGTDDTTKVEKHEDSKTLTSKGTPTPIKAEVDKVPSGTKQEPVVERIGTPTSSVASLRPVKTPTSGKGAPVVGETSKSDVGSDTPTKETSTSISTREGSVTQVSTTSGKRNVNKISIADKSGQTGTDDTTKVEKPEDSKPSTSKGTGSGNQPKKDENKNETGFKDGRLNLTNDELKKVRDSLRKNQGKGSASSDNLSTTGDGGLINTRYGRRLNLDPQKKVNINSNQIITSGANDDKVKVFKGYFETKADEDKKPMVSNIKGSINMNAGIDGKKVTLLSKEIKLEEKDKSVSKMNFDKGFTSKLSRELAEGYKSRLLRAEFENKPTTPSTSKASQQSKKSSSVKQDSSKDTKLGNAMDLITQKLSELKGKGDKNKLEKAKQLLTQLKEKVNKN